MTGRRRMPQRLHPPRLAALTQPDPGHADPATSTPSDLAALLHAPQSTSHFYLYRLERRGCPRRPHPGTRRLARHAGGGRTREVAPAGAQDEGEEASRRVVFETVGRGGETPRSWRYM